LLRSLSTTLPAMSLLSIPRDIWIDKVLHYLSFKEITRVHSATSNAADRAAFENCIDGWCGAESVLVGGGQHVQIKGMEARKLRTCSVVLKKGFILDRFSFFMPQLKEVTFRGGSIENNEQLEQVIHQCTSKLTNLSILLCPMVTSDGLIRSISRCTQLTTLSVLRCDSIDSAALAATIKMCPNLRHFAFTHTEIEAVLSGLQDGPKLTSLECNSTHINQISLNKIAESMPQLQSLKFSGINMMHDNLNFRDILLACGQLKCFHLTGVYQRIDDKLRCFEGQHFLRLEELNVKEYRTLSDEGVTVMARACPNLRVLNISTCMDITNAAIMEVGTCCRSLTSLDATYCVLLTDAAFDTLNPASLTTLLIEQTAVTGSFASHVLGAGSALRELDVSHCAMLKTVFARCVTSTRLEKLKIHHTNLNAMAWAALSARLCNVRYIDAAGCSGVTGATVLKIVTSAPVKYFNVFKCGVSEKITAQYPCVRYIAPHLYEGYEV